MADVSSTSSTTSSTSSSSTGTVSNGRYWGLASGLDVDSIVTGLLSDDQARIDKVKGQEQTLNWQQTAYRSITTQLQTFESAYLQLGQSTSMASSSMYTSYTASSNNSVLAATAGSDATGATQNVTITQSASAATITGDSTNSTIKGNVDIGGVGLEALQSEASAAEKAGLADPSFNVTVDGVSKSISFTADELNGVTDASDMVNLLNTKLTSAFGTVPDDSSGTVDTSTDVSKVLASVDSSGNLQLNAGGGYQSIISVSASSQSFDPRLLGAEANAASSLNQSAPTISLTYNGTKSTLTFSGSDFPDDTDDSTGSNAQTAIQNQLDTAFGAGTLTAKVDSTTGQLTITDGSGTNVSYTTANTSLNALTGLGLTSSQGNRLSTSSTTLQQLLNLSDNDTSDVTVEINGKSVDLGAPSTTVANAFSTLNSSGAGVTLSYDSTTDTASLVSNQSGSSGEVDISEDTSGFFNALGMSTTDSTEDVAHGNDAVISINGNSYTRATNDFTIDGVNYSINSPITSDSPASSKSATVTLTPDTSNLKAGINNFITAYNTLITSINAQINTQPNSNYPPLTSAETSTMTTDQVTQYNADAQQGLLYSDPTLSGILNSMRDALYQPVTLSDGKSVSLYDFGITTSDDPENNGTLEINAADEQTFQDALSNNSSEISEFFTKESSITLNADPEGSSQVAAQKTRTQQEGLVDRLDDIIQGATATVGGVPGSLLAIAGEQNDSTATNNTIYNQLTQLASTVTDYTTQLTDKQNNLYTEFENLETYMEQANSQSATLTSMLG
jgi:flagellar hook-associated protein 2